MPHDDLIITIGALVLGLGLLHVINRATTALAYEVGEDFPNKYDRIPGIDCGLGFKVRPGPNRVARQKQHDDYCERTYIPLGQGMRVIKPSEKDFDPLHPGFLPGDKSERTKFPTVGELDYPNAYGQPGLQLDPENKGSAPDAGLKFDPSRAWNVATYARAYATTPVPCAAACAPFKNSPGTYATCCKQHAVPKPAAKPKTGSVTYPLNAVVKSTRPKSPSTYSLMENVGGSFSDLPFYKIRNTNQTGVPSGVGCQPGQLPANISNTECHSQKSHPGPKIPREEFSIPEPRSGNFTYNTIVTIPLDEKPDDLTIEFNGQEHSGDCDPTRNGHKFMVPIAGGDGKAGFWIQEQCQYNKQVPLSYNLERGKTYNITVTNQVVGSDTVSNLYIQGPGESNAKLVLSHRVQGGAQFATQAGNRVANRIDNINSPCGQCCPKGSPKVMGKTITQCATVSG